MDHHKQFINSCKDGNLELAECDYYAFRDACEYGRLEVAQWLLKVNPNIDISANGNHVFKMACLYGNLDIAQWLLQVKPTIDISSTNDYAIKYASNHGKTHIVEWLQSLKPFKYNVTFQNNRQISLKINTLFEENILFILYSLTCNNYKNNLTVNIILNISKYL